MAIAEGCCRHGPPWIGDAQDWLMILVAAVIAFGVVRGYCELWKLRRRTQALTTYRR